MHVPNLTSELVPVPGRNTISGTAFTRGQFHANTRYVFVTVEGAAVTVKWGSGDATHTLAQGTSGLWRLDTLLGATFAGDGTLSVTEFTK